MVAGTAGAPLELHVLDESLTNRPPRGEASGQSPGARATRKTVPGGLEKPAPAGWELNLLQLRITPRPLGRAKQPAAERLCS